MAKQNQPDNLLNYIPVPSVDWERDEDKIHLLVPKFRAKWLLNLCGRVGVNSRMRLHLDQYGSCVWEACDGKNTVYDIGQILIARFGNNVDPVYDRLGQFILHLARNNFITFSSISGSN